MRPSIPHGLRTWHDPLYGATFALLVCEADEVPRLFRKVKRGGEWDIPGARSLGQTLRLTDTGGLLVGIWLKPGASLVTIAHEALHATCYVLGEAGLTLSRDSEEAFTYYQGWVLDQILDR